MGLEVVLGLKSEMMPSFSMIKTPSSRSLGKTCSVYYLYRASNLWCHRLFRAQLGLHFNGQFTLRVDKIAAVVVEEMDGSDPLILLQGNVCVVKWLSQSLGCAPHLPQEGAMVEASLR